MSAKMNYEIVMQGVHFCRICGKLPRFCTDPVNHGDPDWEEDDDD